MLAVSVTSDAYTGIEPHRHTDDRERDGSHEPVAHLPSVTVCLARHPASAAAAVGPRVVDVAVVGVKRVLSVMESPAERVELSPDETVGLSLPVSQIGTNLGPPGDRRYSGRRAQ